MVKFVWSERPWCALPGTGRIAEADGVVFAFPQAYRSHIAHALVWSEDWDVPQFIGVGRLEHYAGSLWTETITVTSGGRMGVSPGRLAPSGADWVVELTPTGEPVLRPLSAGE